MDVSMSLTRIDGGRMVDEGMAGFFLDRRFSKTVWRGDDLMDFIVERVLGGSVDYFSWVCN